MALPAAVQAQIDKATELHKQAYPEGAATPPPAAPPEGTPPPAQPQEQPAAPAAPEPPIAPPEPPPPGDTVSREAYEALRAQFEKVQQSLSTLRGKYDAEPGRLSAEVSALRAEVRALADENQRLRSGVVPAAEPAQPAPPVGVTPEAFTKWFEDTYGPEHREEFDAYIKSKIQESTGDIRQVVEKVQSTTVKTEKERYWGALDEAVPEWEQIYQDPRFKELLTEEEGNTGLPKAQFAKRWEDSLNAERVIPYLKEYRERYGTPPPAAAPAGAPPAAGAKLDKNAFVAPKSTPGGQGGPGSKPEDNIPFIKASEIRALAIEASTTRKWVGKDKELAALRAKHNAAISAGRVLAGQ